MVQPPNCIAWVSWKGSYKFLQNLSVRYKKSNKTKVTHTARWWHLMKYWVCTVVITWLRLDVKVVWWRLCLALHRSFRQSIINTVFCVIKPHSRARNWENDTVKSLKSASVAEINSSFNPTDPIILFSHVLIFFSSDCMMVCYMMVRRGVAPSSLPAKFHLILNWSFWKFSRWFSLWRSYICLGMCSRKFQWQWPPMHQQQQQQQEKFYWSKMIDLLSAAAGCVNF